jgi:ribosomal protein L12E/L44/L45/RPP1/RPP2
MAKKSKTLIAAFSCLILLAGAYYFSTVLKNRKNNDASSPYSSSQKLGDFERSELVKIEAPGLSLEKNDETWELVYLEGGIPKAGIELDQWQIQMLTYSLAGVWIEEIIEEAVADLSVYGLDKPSSRAAITDSSGKKAEYILGDMTPSRTAYYFMEEGSPTVYTISANQAASIRFTLDTIRQRTLFPAFAQEELTRLRLESAEKRIEISVKPESVDPYLASEFSPYVLTSPYLLPRGVNFDAFGSLLTPFNNLQVEEFIDDDPSSLKPYGLDQPYRIFLEAGNRSLDLLLGSEADGNRYAKLANAPSVFTLKGFESVINVKPFSLIDKFFILINIDAVEHLSIRSLAGVTGGEKNLAADFQGTREEGVYFLNGVKAETDSFKSFYQAVIGLLADAEYSSPALNPAGEETIAIEFRLKNGKRAGITLIPYNRDFYAVRQDGATEFLISRNQIRKIYEAVEKVVYE